MYKGEKRHLQPNKQRMLPRILSPIYLGITERFTEVKYNWCQTLRSHGVLLETSLELAKHKGRRTTLFKPSLGEYGHRDWTQLRVNSHWLAPKPDLKTGAQLLAAWSRFKAPRQPNLDVISAVTNTLRAKKRPFHVRDHGGV